MRRSSVGCDRAWWQRGRRAGGAAERGRGVVAALRRFFLKKIVVPEGERIREPRGHRGPPTRPFGQTDVLDRALPFHDFFSLCGAEPIKISPYFKYLFLIS